MNTSVNAPDLASTYLRLRPDASIEPLVVDAGFWPKIATGLLGDFHNEYLVTLHSYTDQWPQWEMHPNGDEVVCLLSGSIDFILEEGAEQRTVSLRGAGQFVLVSRGTWHTAAIIEPSTLLFITAGEGTQHRAAS